MMIGRGTVTLTFEDRWAMIDTTVRFYFVKWISIHHLVQKNEGRSVFFSMGIFFASLVWKYLLERAMHDLD
jgi:hypothetical protein